MNIQKDAVALLLKEKEKTLANNLLIGSYTSERTSKLEAVKMAIKRTQAAIDEYEKILDYFKTIPNEVTHD